MGGKPSIIVQASNSYGHSNKNTLIKLSSNDGITYYPQGEYIYADGPLYVTIEKKNKLGITTRKWGSWTSKVGDCRELLLENVAYIYIGPIDQWSRNVLLQVTLKDKI